MLCEEGQSCCGLLCPDLGCMRRRRRRRRRRRVDVTPPRVDDARRRETFGQPVWNPYTPSNKWCVWSGDLMLELGARFHRLRGFNEPLQKLRREDERRAVICWADWRQLSALWWAAAVRHPGRYRERRRKRRKTGGGETRFVRAESAHRGQRAAGVYPLQGWRDGWMEGWSCWDARCRWRPQKVARKPAAASAPYPLHHHHP